MSSKELLNFNLFTREAMYFMFYRALAIALTFRFKKLNSFTCCINECHLSCKFARIDFNLCESSERDGRLFGQIAWRNLIFEKKNKS